MIPALLPPVTVHPPPVGVVRNSIPVLTIRQYSVTLTINRELVGGLRGSNLTSTFIT